MPSLLDQYSSVIGPEFGLYYRGVDIEVEQRIAVAVSHTFCVCSVKLDHCSGVVQCIVFLHSPVPVRSSFARQDVDHSTAISRHARDRGAQTGQTLMIIILFENRSILAVFSYCPREGATYSHNWNNDSMALDISSY